MSNSYTIHHGDCIDVLRSLAENSVDAVVTDPPYSLEFLGDTWSDYVPDNAVTKRSGWEHANSGASITSVRPYGGVRVVFGQRRRTWRCRSCGRRDAFRNKCKCDKPDWKHEWVDEKPYEFEAFQEWSKRWAVAVLRVLRPGGHMLAFGGARTWHRLATAIEDAGFEIRDTLMWIYGSGFPKNYNISDGIGTALKPAHDPIILARKPIEEKNLRSNYSIYGTGGLNIDACRVTDGRWPANVIFGCACKGKHDSMCAVRQLESQHSQASKFFYCAKPDKNERTAGGQIDNQHPTVKPIALMRYLCRLITPPGGTVLDPFMGSGSTIIAALQEGFSAIGIEREAKYIEIARARIEAMTTKT